MSEFQPIRPIEYSKLRISEGGENGEDVEFMLSAEYDRVVHYPRFGAFIVKIVDDEHGFVQVSVTEDYATRIAESLDTPIDVRDWVNEREHDLIVKGKMNIMEQTFGEELSDIDFNFPMDGDDE